MAKDPNYSSTPERSVEEDQGYLVPNWDQRGIMDEGYAIQQNFDDASKYVDNDLQSFLQGTSRFSMSSIAPGGTYEFGSGTLSAPGIRWAADTDSGFYLPAVGDMAAVIGGVEITSWTALGFHIDAMTAGSVLFAGTSGLVSQDNTNFFFDDTANLLKIGGLTASRLVQTDANKYLASVTALENFIIGTSNQVIVNTDGNGGVVLSTPQNTHTAADVTFTSLTLNGGLSTPFISMTGYMEFTPDNTHDLTLVGARPRDIQAGRDIYAGGKFLGVFPGIAYSFADETTSGIRLAASADLRVVANTTDAMKWSDSGLIGVVVHSGLPLSWGSYGVATTDLFLRRGAANTLSQSNGVNPQTQYLYNTTDSDASPVNFERAWFTWDSNAFHVLTAAGGSGSGRDFIIGTQGATNLTFRTGAVNRWQFNGNGHLLAVAHNTYDWGSGAADPRTIYAGTSVRSGDGTVTAPAFQFATDGLNNGWYRRAAGTMSWALSGERKFELADLLIGMASTTALQWANSADINTAGAYDLFISRVSAGIGKVTNAANACSWRVHGNATQYTEFNHDGTDGTIYASTGQLYLIGAGGAGWTLQQAGHLLARNDNVYDIGASGATRPRTIYAGTSVFAAASIGVARATADSGVLLHLGTGGTTQGYIRMESAGAASRTANLYVPSGGGLQIDTAGNSYSIVLNGNDIQLYPGGGNGWQVTSGRNLIASTDNTYDIGASGATRPRTGYFGTSLNVVAGAVLADTNGITMGDAKNIIVNATTGTKIGTATTQKIGLWNATPVVQQVGGVTLTNNVTSGGTTNQLDDFTSLTIYATDAAAIRNNIYQLGRKLKLVTDALRTMGALQNADA